MALAVVSAITVLVPLSGAATAAPARDPHGPTLPSEEQVQKAKKDVEDKKASVAAIQASLDAAQSRLMQAVTQAEIASEKYNGAMWRLSVAQQKSQAAKTAAVQAAQHVAD